MYVILLNVRWQFAKVYLDDIIIFSISVQSIAIMLSQSDVYSPLQGYG